MREKLQQPPTIGTDKNSSIYNHRVAVKSLNIIYKCRLSSGKSQQICLNPLFHFIKILSCCRTNGVTGLKIISSSDNIFSGADACAVVVLEKIDVPPKSVRRLRAEKRER